MRKRFPAGRENRGASDAAARRLCAKPCMSHLVVLAALKGLDARRSNLLGLHLRLLVEGDARVRLDLQPCHATLN